MALGRALLLTSRRCWRCCLFAERQFISNSMSNSKNYFNFTGAADVGIQDSNDGQNSLQLPNVYQFKLQRLSPKSNCLLVKRLSDKAIMPARAFASTDGCLVFSARDTKVPARDKAWVPTDLRIMVDKNVSAHIVPYSGSNLARDHSIDVGHIVLHCHYQNRVYVPLYNHSNIDYHVKVGDKIAQLLLAY